jgi:transporter family protein
MDAFGWAVLTALIWGGVPLLEKLGLAKIDPLGGVFFRSFGVVVGILLLGFFVIKPHHFKGAELKSAAMLVIAGLLASFVAQIAFYNSLKTGEISKVVLIAGSYPLISFLLGIFVLGESVTMFKIVGVVFVTVGIWFLK